MGPAALKILAAAQITSLGFTAQVTPWQATCSPLVPGQLADCGTPSGIAGTAPASVDLELALAATAGQATETEGAFSIFTPSIGAPSGTVPSPAGASATPPSFAGKISLYSVYPAPDAGFPPYLQVRIDLASPIRATCAESVRLRDPMELPPIVCAAIDNPPSEASVTQAGVTITFRAK